mmetsp:Transcript_91345/g.254372  ORF Transcript_91345/g.254372 Transcript_91345/m.254372 type:complete len:546 (-) Transcript_91345:236-1873(-)
MAATDWWLTFWIQGTPRGESLDMNGSLVYGVLTVGHAVGLVATNLASGFAGAHASRNLHSQCLGHILRAPARWFDETPSGRTVSRMSADIGNVDLKLPTLIDHMCHMLCASIVNAISICVVVPWMGIFIAAIAPLFVWLDIIVNQSSREVKRIANNALSPILTMAQEAGNARLLVRVMSQESWLHDQFLAYVDMYNAAYYASSSLMSFLRCSGNMVGVLVSFLSSFLVWMVPGMVADAPGGATAVALALTYSFVIPYFLSFLSLFASMVRIFLASLERLLELTSSSVPQEEAWHVAGDPVSGWPASGKVEFHAATLRYMPHLPPAVNNLTMTIAPGERLGVVGRTGAGKSSLSVMLLRIVELDGGSIIIDGVNVARIGLHALRRAVAMVPQSPFLFQGPVSRNLDPMSMHSSDIMVAALGRVGLQVDLTAEVGEGGEQFSAGQRQLIAIARATLSNARIVVMDEPTASCDAQTDARIQEAVQMAFAGRTVLCIAHRLNTILGYDRVLVMEAGAAAELGSPGHLLKIRDSHFAQMVAKSRSVEAGH